MSMRAIAVLTLAIAGCASAPAAAPASRAVEDHELARIPDVPPSELAGRIVELQRPRRGEVTDAFMVVEVNLQSADSARVRSALAVLEAMATAMDRSAEPEPVDDDPEEGLETLVDHVSTLLNQRLRTTPCSLVFAVEHAAVRFRRLPGYYPPNARHTAMRRHRRSLQGIACGVRSLDKKVEACRAKHEVPGKAMVRMVVDRQGIVTSAVTTGDLANTPAGDCIAAAAKAVTFPVSDESDVITYPGY